MPKNVQLKKTTVTIVDVQAAQITALTATLDDGAQIAVTTPVVVGDWVITNPQTGEVSILSDAEFQAEEVIS